jgi:hypothetical protein
VLFLIALIVGIDQVTKNIGQVILSPNPPVSLLNGKEGMKRRSS